MNEMIERVREMFDINEEEDVFSGLERVREELETLDILKEENEKAKQMYMSLQQQHKHLAKNMKVEGGNEYIEELLRDKT